MPYISLNALRLHYRVSGSQSNGAGYCFVLVHGWCCNSSDWDSLTPYLEQHGEVLALDLRGHGRSGRSATGDYCLPAMSSDIAGLVEQLDLNGVVLIAHSAGSEISVHYALHHAERVRAIVTIDPAYGIDARERPGVAKFSKDLAEASSTHPIEQFFASVESSPPAARGAREFHRRLASASRIDVAAAMFRELAFGPASFHFSPDSENRLRDLDVPQLSIYRSTGRSGVGVRGKAHPLDRVCVYNGTGHWPHQDRPERFLRDVTGWLEHLTVSDGQRLEVDQ